MKPTTDKAALAAALELDGLTPYTAQREAERLVTFLEDMGWIVAPTVSLPKSAPKGREGTLDLTDFTEQVLYVVAAYSPLSTDELNNRYQGFSERLPSLFPKRSWDTPRKRLAEMERAGFVRQVRRSDGKQRTRNGFGMWEATAKGRERCSALREVAA